MSWNFDGSDDIGNELEMSYELDDLRKKLHKALDFIAMVEDNTKMQHQHKDYYERLCCLSERARELLEELE